MDSGSRPEAGVRGATRTSPKGRVDTTSQPCSHSFHLQPLKPQRLAKDEQHKATEGAGKHFLGPPVFLPTSPPSVVPVTPTPYPHTPTPPFPAPLFLPHPSRARYRSHPPSPLCPQASPSLTASTVFLFFTTMFPVSPFRLGYNF